MSETLLLNNGNNTVSLDVNALAKHINNGIIKKEENPYGYNNTVKYDVYSQPNKLLQKILTRRGDLQFSFLYYVGDDGNVADETIEMSFHSKFIPGQKDTGIIVAHGSQQHGRTVAEAEKWSNMYKLINLCTERYTARQKTKRR